MGGHDTGAADAGAGLAALAVLQDPVRRALYRHVAGSEGPVDRDAAAAAVGVARPLAAFHLDKLVNAGLLVSGAAPAGTRTGPGRPRKRYRRAGPITVSIPPRNYGLIGRILAAAVGARWRAMKAPVAANARTQGALAARGALRRLRGTRSRRRVASAAVRELERLGYAPRSDDDLVVLRNCPYEALSRERPAEVCHLNREFLEGFAATLDPSVQVAAVDPARRAGGCCAALRVSA